VTAAAEWRGFFGRDFSLASEQIPNLRALRPHG
jgi:hypothetical protein